MADVSTFTSWSSTAANNNPTGGTVIGAGLDDNLREIQAQTASWRDGTGYGILTVTSVSGSNTITGNTSPAPSLAANQKFLLFPAGTNTGAVTLNLNSSAAKNVYAGNSALVGGELHANIPVVVEYDGTQFQLLGPVFKQPTIQVFTSGSAATYTTPTGATRIRVRMVGGGGGGGAQQTNAGANGADTTFGTLTAAKGTGGANAGGAPGAGGAGTNGDINIAGSGGQAGSANAAVSAGLAGGSGGPGPWGGAGSGGVNNTAGGNASANSGSGGGGGGGSTGPQSSGSGGGAGAYVEKNIIGPAATYTYTVGAGGTGGSAGGAAGGNGAAGIIIVEEFYN